MSQITSQSRFLYSWAEEQSEQSSTVGSSDFLELNNGHQRIQRRGGVVVWSWIKDVH